MKLAGIFAAILLFAVTGLRAQSVQATPYFLLPPAPNFVAPLAPAPVALALSAAPAPAPAPVPVPQLPQGVYPEQYWQAYAGFTYFRFYEVPGTIVNMSGFQGSMAYYFKEWLAAEGEVNGAFGTQTGGAATFVFVGGGLRARYAPSRAYDVWAHALAGGSHFTPETAYGTPSAFAYELGVGADLNINRHIGYRVEGDFIGTQLFGTYQVSPRLAGGIVYNF